MSKKDGLEIFELFRNGSSKSAATEAPPPPKERPTAVRPAPAPAPAPVAAPAPAAPRTGPGDTVISMKLNTALVGLMVGTACLFGCFALGVQYERRHRGAAPAPQETAQAPETLPSASLPAIARETRRESPAAEPAPVAATTESRPAPVAEPKKGYTLQLMSYGPDQESIAQRMVKRVRENKGEDASVIRDRNGNFIVIAGFVEKQSGAEADAVVAKYRSVSSRLNMTFNLDWIPATK